MNNAPALVKMLNNTSLFGLNSEEKNKVKFHPTDKMMLQVRAGKLINMKDGEPVEGTELRINQNILVYPDVPLVANMYHSIVSYNPELVKAGAIITPLAVIVPPKTENGIALFIRPTRKIDLSEFEHIFELYQID